VKGEEKLKAWGQMFQGEQMCPGDAKTQRAVERRNQANWRRTRGENVQGLDEPIQLVEVERAVKKMKSGKAPGKTASRRSC